LSVAPAKPAALVFDVLSVTKRTQLLEAASTVPGPQPPPGVCVPVPKVSCGASTNTPCLAVTAPGQFSFDGAVPARHTVQGMGQTSFGVVVAPAPNSKNTYQDELNVVTASYPELEPQRFHGWFPTRGPTPPGVLGRCRPF
jgi:hypothetical protein